MNDYWTNTEKLQAFFDYPITDEKKFIKRKSEVLSRNFQREALTEHLIIFNKKYYCSDETIVNINKLKNPKSVAIVGGQQAGILTGPLYTIHKIITIIKLAKEQEEKLRTPVVPIFWIAGEDHDFDEINHIYTIFPNNLKKRKVNQNVSGKVPTSNIQIDKVALVSFVTDVLRDLEETNYTFELKEQLIANIECSDSYVDFFSFLIHKLFNKTGIVLLDANDPILRGIEKPFLKQLIKENEKISEAFLDRANDFYNNGYGEPIERTETSAHLFYHYNGSRMLLYRTSTGLFTDKSGNVSLTEEELIKLIEKQPHKFSNNVVTRPLMQEFLLPVLAFVAGPGEVAYWATLKKVFHLFSFYVPPVIPRLSITIVEPKIEKYVKQVNLSFEEALSFGTVNARKYSSYSNEKTTIEETLQETLYQLEKIHLPLKQLATKYDQGLKAMADKNEMIIKKEISFLAKKIEKSVRQKHERELLKFDSIDTNLFPNGGLQERSLNVIKYVNAYGFDFVEKLLQLPFVVNEKHKLVLIK